MFNQHRKTQFEIYNKSRDFLIENPDMLLSLEEYFTKFIVDLLKSNIKEIESDYNESSYLFPFWQNYPPDDRGRKPRGDQFPWIEVGEHSVGVKLARLLEQSNFEILDTGLPTGPDQRFVLRGQIIKDLTNGLTDAIWLFVDIKSVGPRDDFKHTVMSHNQISGDGLWVNEEEGIKNTILTATGARTSHDFHCSLPPLYVLSDGTVLPVVILALKPVYSMLNLDDPSVGGQPLSRITIATIPNGILLTIKPDYLSQYPNLLFPGKDDKGKNPLKVRVRFSFDILQEIAKWRIINIPL